MHLSMWKAALLVIGLVLLLGNGCSGGDGSKGDSAAGTHTNKGGEQAIKADLNAALKKSFKESDAPGVVAAVQTPDYTWVQAMGVADRATGKQMTPEVHHRIGSVTKTFTATLLLKAADEGLLSLDDSIDQYIKGVPNGDKITLRQMSDMTSGLDSYTDDEQWVKEWSSDPTRIWKPEELARIGIKESPLFEPGTGWFYSNTNFVLLGLVLERVTGEPIGQLYQKEIIEPLDLNETSFPGADSALPEPYDHGYTLQGKSSGKSPSTPPTGALGGVDGRRDDLDGGRPASLRAGFGHRKGTALTQGAIRAAPLLRQRRTTAQQAASQRRPGLRHRA